MTVATPSTTKKPRKVAAPSDTAFKRVGRLASLGLEEPWHAALLLPTGYEDLRRTAEAFSDLDVKDPRVMWLRPVMAPRSFFSSGVPRVVIDMADNTGAIARCTIFGDTKIWGERFAELAPGWFIVEGDVWRDEMQFKIKEEAPQEWVGRLRPRYPGKPNYLKPEDTRARVLGWLSRAIPVASQWVEEQLAPLIGRDELLADAGAPGWDLESLLLEAHQPTSDAMLELSRTALRRVAAFASLAKAHQHILRRPPARPVRLQSLRERAAAFAFQLTPDQRSAVIAFATELKKPSAMRGLLVGDVGSGKTAVFSLLAASTVDADPTHRVAILLPNLPLAEQVHREFTTWWPDLDVALVTGESAAQDLDRRRVLIGTTALLHRDVGELTLVIVDEEQKYSVEQRQALAGQQGHLLTASATCIPRSLALAKYGALTLAEIRSQHADKRIQTRLWQREDRSRLSRDLRQYLAAGEKLLIIYPMKESSEENEDRRNVEDAAAVWEPLAPGRVRLLTGSASDEHKSRVMADMRDGRAQILLATTVVEVGITIPGLRRVLIMAPERYGLTTLHQLRGRVARHGGDGWCDLFASEPLAAKADERLTAFLSCKDGFEVAELDLRLRGFGDLADGGSRQSGADNAFLFGETIRPEDMLWAEPIWKRVVEGSTGP